MGFDLSELNKPEWVFRSETAGNWGVYHYSVNAMIEVEKYSSGEISDPIEAVRALISVICKAHAENQDDDDSPSTKPTEEQLARFTDDDINEFSRQFIEHHNSLNKEDEIKRTEGLSDVEFLLKILETENKKQSEKMSEVASRLLNSLDGLLGSKNAGIKSASEILLEQSTNINNFYKPKTSIFDSSYEPISLPPNPAHETNNRLGDVTDRLEYLVGFGEKALRIMNELQVASAVFLEDFSTEAEKNSKAANKAIWVGIFAILFSVAQIGYTEFWRVPHDTAAMDAALISVRGEIDELQSSLGDDLARFQAAQADTAAAITDSINSTVETNTALLQKIDLLLQQQRLRDEAIIEALGAISEMVEG